MSEAHLKVISTLAAGGDRAMGLADAIVLLVKEGGELGALERGEGFDPDGVRREIKLPPAEWFVRLARAAELGAFEVLEVRTIVDRILSTPSPS